MKVKDLKRLVKDYSDDAELELCVVYKTDEEHHHLLLLGEDLGIIETPESKDKSKVDVVLLEMVVKNPYQH